MIIKKVFFAAILTLFGCNVLHAMQESSQQKIVQTETSKENAKQFYRFPAFLFFQPHPEVEVTGKNFDREALQFLIHSFGHNCKDELTRKGIQDLVDYACALYIAQAVLLTKPVEEWTLDDVQKINALLVDFDKMPNVLLAQRGLWKNGLTLFARFPSDDPRAEQASLVHARISAIISHETIETPDALRQRLSEKDWNDLNQFFTFGRHSWTQIPHRMEEYIKTLHTLCREKSSPFKISGFAHQHLTETHPFRDGHGRTARILSFSSLLEAKRCPPLTDGKYCQAALDLAALEHYFEEAVQKTEEKYTCLKDLNGVSIETPLHADEIKGIKDIYDSFKVSDPHAKECIRKLKQYALKKLNVFNQLCQNCGKEAQSRCGGCHFTKYCSAACLKNDRQRHKTFCQNILVDLSKAKK